MPFGYIRKRTIAEIVAFIQNNQTDYSISQLCSALKFPRSTYYKALVCVPSNRRQEYEEFSRKVKQVHEDSKKRYGAVKICRVLNDSGTPCSVKRVQRHMAEQGLRPVVVKKYNHHASHGLVPETKRYAIYKNQKLHYTKTSKPSQQYGRCKFPGFP